jgi:hypothetical protein
MVRAYSKTGNSKCMEKTRNQTQCVPVERVAQLLSMGVGYEGYVRFIDGRQVYMEITPEDNAAISELYFPEDTLLSVHVMNPDNPTVVKESRYWDVADLVINDISVTGLGVGVIENSGTKATFRLRNSKGFSPKYYSTGWSGGSRGRIKTYRVKIAAKYTGWVFFGIGSAYDLVQWKSGRQTFIKSTTNTIFSAIGTFGYIPGLIVYAIYLCMDSFGVPDAVRASRVPSDPSIQSADATEVKRVELIEPIPKKESVFTPREQPILKQGHKPWDEK